MFCKRNVNGISVCAERQFYAVFPPQDARKHDKAQRERGRRAVLRPRLLFQRTEGGGEIVLRALRAQVFSRGQGAQAVRLGKAFAYGEHAGRVALRLVYARRVRKGKFSAPRLPDLRLKWRW